MQYILRRNPFAAVVFVIIVIIVIIIIIMIIIEVVFIGILLLVRPGRHSCEPIIVMVQWLLVTLHV